MTVFAFCSLTQAQELLGFGRRSQWRLLSRVPISASRPGHSKRDPAAGSGQAEYEASSSGFCRFIFTVEADHASFSVP